MATEWPIFLAQCVHISYRVFIKYCVFFLFFVSSWSLSWWKGCFLVFLLFLFSFINPHLWSRARLMCHRVGGGLWNDRRPSALPQPANHHYSSSRIYLRLDRQRYSVFIRYCVFFQEFSIFCDISLASTGLLLVVQIASH